MTEREGELIQPADRYAGAHAPGRLPGVRQQPPTDAVEQPALRRGARAGFAVGFSVLGALVIVLIKNLVLENIPVISDFLAEVIHAIEARM